MIINREIKEKLPIDDLDNLYVVADFDRTITKGNSKTSWSILSGSNLVPEYYVKERQALYDIYRPIEIDESLDYNYRLKMMNEWWRKHIELFIKYQLTEKIFKEASNLRVMEFRDGAKNFLEFLKENNIPLIIISAGIGNFISSFLDSNNVYYDNIYISSNTIIFKDGVAYGVDNNIIHSLNKNEVSLPPEIREKILGREQVLLLGDQVSDLNMVDKSKHDTVITVGFSVDDSKNIDILKNNFDSVCEEKDDYFSLKRTLFKQVKNMK